MTQPLDDAYANVRESFGGLPGAYGDGYHDDTDAIQRAIDTGLHVLFPQSVDPYTGVLNPYVVLGTIKFNNDGQRSTFLAGAFLRLDDDLAGVIISGPSQTFTGLRIRVGKDEPSGGGGPKPPSHQARPDPCLLISGADGLLLEDVWVECPAAVTLVRVKRTDGITVRGGVIVGNQAGIGLGFMDEVRNFEATGLAIHQLAQGVVFEGTAECISFLGGTNEAQTQNMIEVRDGAQVHGLSLIGVHMECNFKTGAYHFVSVLQGGSVYGGVFAGCQFGGLRPDADGVGPRRVFVISGGWHGVEVSGCLHQANKIGGVEQLPAAHAVWEIDGTATVSESCDLFNDWLDVAVVTGDNAGSLAVLSSQAGVPRTMVIAANEIQIEASEVGFFDALPVPRSRGYRVGPNYSRTFSSTNTFDVLGALLRDLAAMGLIECRIGSTLPPP